MRELHTIGSLRAMPLSKQRLRRSATVHRIGATNTSFVAPSLAQVQQNPPGDVLAGAAQAMLTYFSQNGVPSEHDAVGVVTQFQTAFNNDPLGQANGDAGQLDEDGGYGPNTHDALASIAGSAPAVNTGPAPSPSPLVTPTPGVTPAIVPAGGASTFPWGEVLLIAAVAGGAYWLFFRKKGRRSSAHRSGRTTSIEVKGNPRRRGKARRSAGAIV
jgi:hypothetical protein